MNPDFVERLGVKTLGTSSDPFENETLNRLQMLTCLIPVFGMFPSAWILSRRKSDRQLRGTSRLSLTLGMLWGIGFLLMNAGVGFSETGAASSAGMAFMVTNTLWSSSYFVTLLWLMMRMWQRQPLQVAGLSRISKFLP